MTSPLSQKQISIEETSIQTLEDYRLVRELGFGSSSRVFLAEQCHPMRRRVALKIMNHSHQGTPAWTFFHRERQILAKLEHRYIARVYGGGTNREGLPFLAMEYVNGVPLMDYCKNKMPDLRDRLKLFLSLCDAVSHVHQKGIIHRDLKPAHFLIVEEEGAAIPKLIDFGISQVEGDAWNSSMQNLPEGIVGTPIYMSPEQSGWLNAPIDSRTDIYALGMILYQMVTDHLPFDSEIMDGFSGNLHSAAIFQKEVPLPSARIRSRPVHTGVNHNLRRKRIRFLRGDLDWIILRALARKPQNRYAGVYQLQRDLGHFLQNKPIFSRSVSSWFRLRKFALRHRWAMLAVGMMTIALISGLVGLSMGLRRAQKAEKKAETARGHAYFTLKLVEEMLISADPEIDGPEVTATAILRKFGNREDWQQNTPSKIRARLHQLVGKSLMSLGDFQTSGPHLDKAFALALQEFPKGHPLRLSIILNKITHDLLTRDADRAASLIKTYFPEARHHLPHEEPLYQAFYRLASTVNYKGLNRAEAKAKKPEL